jgi:adenylate cyclase
MDRISQWAWDRYGARYSWAICAVTFPIALPIYFLLSFVIVGFEGSSRYAEAAAIAVATPMVLVYGMTLPSLARRALSSSGTRPQDRSRDGNERQLLLGSGVGCPSNRRHRCLCGYALSRCRCDRRGDWVAARPLRDLGRSVRSWHVLISVHSFVEAALRPARVAIAEGTGTGASLPALDRPSPRGRTCPCSRRRWHSLWRVRWWGPCWIEPTRSPCSPW